MRERRPGVWQLRVRTRSGRTVTRSHHGDQTSARTALIRLTATVDTTSTPAGTTVEHVVEEWLAFRKPHLSPSTHAGYRRTIDRYLTPHTIWAAVAADVRLRDVDRLYQQLATSGGHDGRELKPATIRQVHAVLRSALGQAVKWEIIAVNPVIGSTPPPLVPTTITPPTVEQVRAVIAALDEDPAFRLFVRLAAVTGARRGEIAALQWGDFEVAELVVSRGVVVDVDGRLVIKHTKTNQTKRVALDEVTLALVAEHRAAAEVAAGREHDPAPPAAGYLFHGVDPALPWRPDRPTKTWGRVRRTAGCDKVRLHDLRHAAATRLLAAGVDARTVAGRLGHADPSMTLRVYAHFVPARDRDAAEILAADLD